ncbi:hypothetical protein [Polyangium sp. y55x31]|uniref:hypothetical protein n=1 Tax=Polyangium sp. y55x31 TaxID=3042688 RepID=UPI002482ACB0|nr:hypothetical protein [Polyangium sp. y55x31]MDI1476475.1 hypothetical protein [Polyangium sp. y55x31]
MSYRIAAAMIAMSVFLGGCVRGPQVAAHVTIGGTLEPAPTDPQCGACSRVYVTSTRELYARVDKGASMPAVDLVLYTAAGDRISNHEGLEPRMLDAGTAVYPVAGGPAMDVGYGVLTWKDPDKGIQSESVMVQASFAGWPSEGGKYPLETGNKRARFDADAPRERHGREAMSPAPSKAKAASASAPAEANHAPRLRPARRTNTAPERIRPARSRRIEFPRKTGQSRAMPKR